MALRKIHNFNKNPNNIMDCMSNKEGAKKLRMPRQPV